MGMNGALPPTIGMSVMRLLTAMAVLWACVSHAQGYPSRPISLVIPFSAGSGSDQVARGIGQAIGPLWPGAVMVVDNKPGAGGIIAAQAVAHAPADGYTLMLTTNTTQSANPHLYKKLPYDPAGDFTPIAALARGSMVLVVPSASPIRSTADLIARARKQPVTFGAGNSSSRVAAELFRQMTGAELTYVGYKGNPQAVTDLVGGQLDIMFADMATALPLVQSGQLRALGYTGLQRSSALPAVPTLDETGIKGYELSYWVAVYGPRAMPVDIRDRLNEMLTRCVRTDVMKAVFSHAVLDVFTTTPEGLAEFQSAETAKWGRIIKAAGIEPE